MFLTSVWNGFQKMLDKDAVAILTFWFRLPFALHTSHFLPFFSSFSHFFLHVLFFLSLFSLSFLAKKFIETLNFCFSHVSSVVDGHVKSFTSPLVLSIGRFARYDIREYSITSLSFRFCFSRFKLATLWTVIKNCLGNSGTWWDLNRALLLTRVW